MEKIKKIFALLALMSMFSSVSAYTDAELEAANFLAEKWIIKDNSENPEDYNLDMEIRRWEMMKITINLTPLEVEDKCEWKFSDIAKDDWICKYAEKARGLWIVAPNKEFRPLDNLTKTEAVKMVFKWLWIEKTFDTGDWQKDYMETAFQKWYIEEKYTDYNANADRWFVFLMAKKALSKEWKKPKTYFKPTSQEAN